MNNRDKTISLRMNIQELYIFNNKVKESGLNITEYIKMCCLTEMPVRKTSIATSSCVIRRELDTLQEKLIRSGNISFSDFDVIKREVERRWK